MHDRPGSWWTRHDVHLKQVILFVQSEKVERKSKQAEQKSWFLWWNMSRLRQCCIFLFSFCSITWQNNVVGLLPSDFPMGWRWVSLLCSEHVLRLFFLHDFCGTIYFTICVCQQLCIIIFLQIVIVYWRKSLTLDMMYHHYHHDHHYHKHHHYCRLHCHLYYHCHFVSNAIHHFM